MRVTSKSYLWMAVGLGVILGSGIVHGIQGDRWGKSEILIKASQRLDDIPQSFGAWSSTESEISKKELKIAEATGSLSRSYVNSETGESVSVMILCGKPGPISVHPPTVCFVGAGWGLQAEPAVATFENSKTESKPATAWNGQFSRRIDGRNISMNTVWAWTNDGTWIASENPRVETAGDQFLYKMYVSTMASETADSKALTTIRSFFHEFLPLVDKALFSKIAESNAEDGTI